MNPLNSPDTLTRALAKDASGRGITATEGRAIRDFRQGKSGFDRVPNVPVTIPAAPSNRNQLIARHRIEGARTVSAADETAPFNNELHFDDGTTQVDIDGSGIVITRAGKTLTINPALISQNMGLVEIDVCSAGVAKKMLIIASAPY